MLNADAIQKIVDLGSHAIEDIGRHQYHVSSRGATLVTVPAVETLKVFSLEQIVNFLKSYFKEDDGDQDQLEVNILDHMNVEVIGRGLNDNCKIERFAESSIEDIFNDFPFGQKMSQEEFIINVMTKFVQDEQTEELLRLVSSIRSDKLQVSDDDGFSQVASTRAGVTLVNEKKVKNIWKLRTYKTFPEIEQPIIPYVLRLHQRGDEMPQFALYDCDGGQWKVETAKDVRQYLVNRLKLELGEKADRVSVL